MSITLESVMSILNKTIDILLVWLVLYYILKSIRNSVKLTLIFKGVVIVIVLKLVSDIFNFVTIGLLLEYIIMWGPLALIIIFQPEIRTVLEQLGRSQLLGRHKVLTVDERERLVYEIVQAMEYLRNVGIDTVKPDVHICRILGKERLALSKWAVAKEQEAADIIKDIADKVGLTASEVDYIFWQFCRPAYP